MGYLGNPANFTGTQANKRISVSADGDQTVFVISGGYQVNQIDVYRNGVKLVGGSDFTAIDGSTVTLLQGTSNGDSVEFVIFENFDVAGALGTSGEQILDGNLTVSNGSITGNLVGNVTGDVAGNVSGTAATFTGHISATQGFSGNISGTAATFTGDVNIGGVLTYDDVTNIDSVGLITARNGLQVLAGIATIAGQANLANVNVSAAATFGGDVSIADKIIHTGDTNTAIRFPANDTFTVETAGVERLRISNNVGVGDDNPNVQFNVKGSGTSHAGINVHAKLEDTTSLAANVGGLLALEGVYNSGGSDAVFAAIHGGKENATDGNYQGYFRVLTRPDGGLPAERLRITSAGNVGIGTNDPIADLSITGANGSTMEFQPDVSSGINRITNYNRSTSTYKNFRLDAAHQDFYISGTERLSITSSGGFHFNNAELIENVEVVSGKLSDNTNIDLEDGMVYLFTTAETTTSTPNIRISSSTTLESAMGDGKAISVTIMTTAAAAGYFTTAKIDGNANGENSYTLNVDWLGGSAPSAGGSSGIDAYNLTIIKQSTKNFNILIAKNNYA